MDNKPQLTTKHIWNLNLGFLGLQVAFSLIMVNTSRIFSALGANTDLLSVLWLGPPLAGLIIQPIIGYWSDRTWTRFGRRIPFMVVGSILAFIILLLIPNLPSSDYIIYPIWDEVVLLFLLQCTFNMVLLSFRTLIGDMLNAKQLNKGFSIQTFISNAGGILGSLLPFTLAFFGMRNEPIEKEYLAPTTSWSLYFASGLLLLTMLWTIFKIKEYPAKECKLISKCESEANQDAKKLQKNFKKIFLKLGLIQFFSWLGFFFLWVYATDAIALKVWKTGDPLSEAYNESGNWFGVLTGVYSIVSIIFSAFLSKLANKYGNKFVYFSSLIACGIGFVSIYFIQNQYLLLLPMIGIGIGWSSILTFPFSIVAEEASTDKMGFQMGLLNVTITLPQIAGSLFGIVLFRYLANSDSMTMILYAGMSLFISAFFVLGLKNKLKNNTP